MTKHLIVCTDEETGHEALYFDGELVLEESTIYASDIASAAGSEAVNVSHMMVCMPDEVNNYPEKFEECLLWVKQDNCNYRTADKGR